MPMMPMGMPMAGMSNQMGGLQMMGPPGGPPMGLQYGAPVMYMPAYSPFAGMPPPMPMGMAPPFMGGPPMAPALTPADRADLKSKLRDQLEYYFSMDNLLKDTHLRSRMTDEGYVPIMLIAGFKKMQELTTDQGLVMEAIAESPLLETSSDNTMMRIKEGWQKWLLQPNAPPQRPA